MEVRRLGPCRIAVYAAATVTRFVRAYLLSWLWYALFLGTPIVGGEISTSAHCAIQVYGDVCSNRQA